MPVCHQHHRQESSTCKSVCRHLKTADRMHVSHSYHSTPPVLLNPSRRPNLNGRNWFFMGNCTNCSECASRIERLRYCCRCYGVYARSAIASVGCFSLLLSFHTPLTWSPRCRDTQCSGTGGACLINCKKQVCRIRTHRPATVD